MAILGHHRNQILETNKRTTIERRSLQSARLGWSGPLAALAVAFVLMAILTQTVQAASFNVIYTFAGEKDGASPFAGVTIDKAGNLYGTTNTGGDYGFGTVFKLKHVGSSWIISPLYSFMGGNDGAAPRSRVIVGPDGALYGVTFQGGGASGNACNSQGCGTVFILRPPMFACKSAMCPWKETVLYRFTGGTDGGEPIGDIVFDKAGNLYGTTEVGGKAHSCSGLGCGTVFELSRSGGSWTQKVLYQFAGSGDGSFPHGSVIFDSSGNLYGTTVAGGANNFGTVFQLTPSGSGWSEKILYSFQNLLDGFEPDTGLIFDPSGNLYGTTLLGGVGLGGTVFQLKPSNGSWELSVLYSLVGILGSLGDLSMDANGNLFGTTNQDGLYVLGSGFKLTQSGGSWTYHSLHDFTGGGDGQLPQSSLVSDSSGNLYGTAAFGGAHGDGVVVEITP